MSALSTFNVRLGVTKTSLESEGGSLGPPSVPDVGHENEYDQVEPSETAALTALFGWTLPPQPAEDKAATPKTSVAPSLSCASSVVSFRNEKNTTPQPAPSISRCGSPSTASVSVQLPSTPPIRRNRNGTHLSCTARCVNDGQDWAFGPQAVEKDNRPQRQFDLLKEHRPYCPYVVRSTIVPSFPMPSGHSAVLNGASGNANGAAGGSPQDGPVEGWRTMLSIVLKARKRSFYGGGRSVAAAGNVAPGGANDSAKMFVTVDQMKVDRVEAMVEGVKKRGVSSLLFST